MNTRMLALCVLVASIVALSTPTPASALGAIPGLPDVTSVVVTPQFEYVQSSLCGGSLNFSYRQRMVIPGVGSVWVLVDLVYSTGPKDAFLQLTCTDGDTVYGIYAFGSCACITGSAATQEVPETGDDADDAERLTPTVPTSDTESAGTPVIEDPRQHREFERTTR